MSDLDKIIRLAPSTLDRFRLDGKAALVVGGTKGLGQAMALALAAAGADVCVVGRGPAGLKDTADAITALGRKGSYFAADVTDEAQVETVRAALPEGMDLLGHVPYSPALGRADLEGRSILGVDPETEAALAEARENLESLVAAESSAANRLATTHAPFQEGP